MPSTVRRISALAMWLICMLVAHNAPVVAQVDCPPPMRVDVTASTKGAGWASRVAWWAEPDLQPAARLLAGHGPTFGPMPGIGALEATPGQPPAVYLLRDLACLDAHGLSTSLPDWVAGVADAEGRFVALRADPSRDPVGSLRVVLRHELAHLALRGAAGGNVPRWLNEGYAQYASGSWDWQEAWRLRFAVLSGGRGVLDALSLRFPSNPDGARLAYMFSYTAVHELVGLAGENGLRATFEELQSGATIDEALRRVFGLTGSQFEDRWRRNVARRYGILYVFSRAALFWTTVTILLVWLGRRRKKRDRVRMERLKEDERREAERAESAERNGREGSASPAARWRPRWPPRRGDYRP